VGVLFVREWRRYGQDRLYVVDRDGDRSIGYYDRKTGRIEISDKAREREAQAALRPFLSGGAPVVSLDAARLPPPPKKDLANNAAGAAVSQRAAELGPSGFQRFVARVLGLRTEATSWQVGAAGERIVGKRLDRLKRAGWYVLHSAELRSGADIDHIVIGPPGVFTINTKHHAHARIWIGTHTMKVNGAGLHYLRNSEHEAASAARRLGKSCRMDVPVTPVLAFVGAAQIMMSFPAPPVLIVRGEQVDKELRRLPQTLSESDQDRIYSVARHRDIWLA
jgi:hypothetical protein